MDVWVLQIAFRLGAAALVHYRLSSSRPVVLERMSIYASEFQMLIRQHFNQVLRMRQAVPARTLAAVPVGAHLQPESLHLEESPDQVIVRFRADAKAPAQVSIFWGVTMQACNELATREDLREPLFQAQRSQQALSAGCDQEVVIGEDLTAIHASGYAAPGRIIAICVAFAGGWQLTLVQARREESGLRSEVLQQLVLSAGTLHRVQGVYGFEEEDGGVECMVCYDRRRSVIVLPCRHCSVCVSCLRALRDERCPLCRSTFSAYLLLPLLQERASPEGAE
ncbi:unnamed protein product [Effrenium voratum]|nr:unnamed protein product [Effrenium voratum]